MKTVLYVPVICVLSLIIFNEGARILAVFPTPSISHQVVFRPLTLELARRGHQVIVLTPDPAFLKGHTPTNLTEIDVHDISYSIWREHFLKTSSSGKKSDLYVQIETALHLFLKIFEEQLKVSEMKEVMKDKNNFDLLLVEACVRPALGLTHVFNVPTILISSLGAAFHNYDVVGVPVHPILYPAFTRQKLNNLTFWDKISEIYNHYKLRRLYYTHERVENEMLRRVFGPDILPIHELNNNIDMLFLNYHPIWEGNFPVPPSVVYIGGIHEKPRKDLPNELKTYLDSSKHGVIYISFGTNVKPSLLPKDKIGIFVKIFSQLPYDVLWKWDDEELPGRSKNIKISKWLPQADLLHHPKIKVFITQGGLQSTEEAISAGIPLIGIPMLGDQWFNVEKYLTHKIGKRLDMDTLSENQLKEAILTIIDDNNYRLNVARLRSLMRDQPQRPLERAVWWVEHVLRHKGAKHLRAPAANISWTQYLELELFLTLLLISLLFVGSSVFLLQCIRKHLQRERKLKGN